jgi:aconitate hydratase A / 2-methylisocitrate dehydratase
MTPSPTAGSDPFKARTTIQTPLGERTIYRLDALRGVGEVASLPYSIKILLEACLRHHDGYVVTDEHVKALAAYDAKNVGEQEVPFNPGRVVLQDFTGVPAVVDLAAMRAGIVRMTGDEATATKVNPLVPCDLVIDHSVQVDAFASGVALSINSEKEFERNNERYQFLKWGQQAFDNFRVVPPATGIVHQVNLEYLAKVVWESPSSGPSPQTPAPVLYPDSLVGTDSHTTMINGLGVVGWGVGGIEAEAVMLGQPIYMLIPEVVGFKLTGRLAEGCTATDLVLRVTELLRAHGVVGRFVEFFGSGLDHMPLANRATIANMAPEYGATMGFFPVDGQTLDYMRLTGRDEKLIQTVEQYCKAQGLWRDDSRGVVYTDVLELDMSTVEPALAGPKRPQDRINLGDMKAQWAKTHSGFQHGPATGSGGTATGTLPAAVAKEQQVTLDGQTFTLKDGAVVIAAITSCTNTSNPEVMIAAGLLARKARKLGLTRKPWVKTSLAPGSKVVTEYYNKANLTEDLEALGFHTVGYGCTTCIGNSGPLPDAVSQAIQSADLVATSVLSGNRNFEGRISPDVKANYLASPPLVVAYAIAGTVDTDLQHDPLAKDANGNDVYLKDIWPTQKEVQDTVATCVTREQFVSQYANVFEGSQEWQDVKSSAGALYNWDEKSTYVQEPPFFVGLDGEVKPIGPITGARCLAKLGDSVTTDHISPAGTIKEDSPAGKYLTDHGVPRSLFNSYGSRRGNDRVMTRGTFANIRVKNQLAPGTEGGFTKFWGTGGHEGSGNREQGSGLKAGDVTTIYEAAVAYGFTKDSDSTPNPDPRTPTPLIVLAGNDYGMGSSRDWAAKGTFLLGVRAVIAASYERIHRSNLVGMGVLPLQFKDGDTHESLGLTGEETFDVQVDDRVQPRQSIKVTAHKPDGTKLTFDTTCRIDTPVEVDYYRNGGILHTVLRKMAEG